MKKKIFIPIFAVLIVAILGFYLGDIIVNSTSPKEHLFEMLSSLVICLGSLIKLVTADRRRKSLAFYETQYADILENSFKERLFSTLLSRDYAAVTAQHSAIPYADILTQCYISNDSGVGGDPDLVHHSAQ